MLYKINGGCTQYPYEVPPHLTIYIDSCYTYFKLIVTVVHTRKLLCNEVENIYLTIQNVILSFLLKVKCVYLTV